MKAERWYQIGKLFEAAVEQAPSQRSAFLDEACTGDEALRNEVESLLDFQERARNFMETPAIEMAADLVAEHPSEPGLEENRLDQLPVVPDQNGPLALKQSPAIVDGKYLLECRLGHGGMAFVYRARHLELGKLFALKLVQPNKSHRPEYLARFRIEAQALGRLNHPNIVQVTDFGVDSSAGPYLVMEYIEGITLSDYIKHKRSLSFHEALPIFSSIAHALDYAHDSGILHRDLKPANIFLAQRESGSHDVKILDFGIARFLAIQLRAKLFQNSRQQRSYACRRVFLFPVSCKANRIRSRRPKDSLIPAQLLVRRSTWPPRS